MSEAQEQIMLEFLDFAEAEDHVYRTFKEQASSDPASTAFDLEYDQVVAFHVSRPVARYVTPSGQVYVVVSCRGLFGPITKADPLHLGVVRQYEVGKHPNPNRVVDDHFVTLFPSDILGAESCGRVPISNLIFSKAWQDSILEKLKEAP